MTPIFLTDLDDTVFTTEKNYKDVDLTTLMRAATATNGNHSYMCDQRQALLAWMSMGATVIPVTARSIGAYERVHIGPFTHGAIVSNGAIVLLPDGTEDLTWKAHTATLCAAAQPYLEAAAAEMDDNDTYRVLRHHRDDDLIGVTIKANLDLHAANGDVDRTIAAARSYILPSLCDSGVVVTSNGNNLSLIPPGISKRAAVTYMLTRDDLKGRPTIGAGDSTSDLGFMSLCDMMLIPTKSQITTTMEGVSQ